MAIEAIVRSPEGWLRFAAPSRIVCAERPSDVGAAIREVERLTRDFGLHAVGWVSYEAGAAFGLAVCRSTESRVPLVWFALFEPASVAVMERLPSSGAGYELGPVEAALSRDEFAHRFAQVRERIAAGETYQANLTFPLRCAFRGEPRALFLDLADAQRGQYATYIETSDIVLCSASPELFFELDGMDIRMRPMKGTAARGLTSVDDDAQRQQLAASEKERAENVMIVDMMRNDVGRIAEVGTVTVPSLFDVERYPTVWQLTSQVAARSSASLESVFAALHPSASVTGAPKMRTMALLAELEGQPRGVYTGAIGHVAPNGNACFSVAIRTAVIDRASSTLSFGVGSGIVWDSQAEAEYEECLLKGTVLGRRPVEFELLETLKWAPADGYFLIERHLARLAASASYFDLRYDIADVRVALAEAVDGQHDARRVRLLVDRQGKVRVEHRALVSSQAPLRVAMSATPIYRRDVWLYHKTTNRGVYDAARQARPDVDDVILWNDAEEVTESTVANVVVELDGIRVTPPVSSGLLAGTFRAELLAKGEIRERVIGKTQLIGAPLWLVNSVHGWRRAQWVDR